MHRKKITKGQAALEFMMTYGWALVVIAAVIAVLAYYGPNPRSLTTNRCVFSPMLSCLGTTLDDSSLKVVLHNNIGQTVYNITANVTVPINLKCYVSSSGAVSADSNIIIICQNTNGLSLTADTEIKMNVYYYKSRGGYQQSLGGDVYAKYNKCNGFIRSRTTNNGKNNPSDVSCCTAVNMCVSDGVCYEGSSGDTHIPSPSWDPSYAPGYDCIGGGWVS